MNEVDRQHKEIIEKILKEGIDKRDRTGVGTKSIFGHTMRFKMSDGFPLLTLRKIHVKSIIHEMLWFLGAFDDEYREFGNTNIKYLIDKNVTFWTEWPHQHYLKSREYRPELPELTMKEFEEKIKIDNKFAREFGSIGKGYGHQWLKFGSLIEEKIIDKEIAVPKSLDDIEDTIKQNVAKKEITFYPGLNQIDYLIKELKKNPDSRRLILMAWKPDEVSEALLPPCHYGFQLYTYKMPVQERISEFKKYINDNNIADDDMKPMDEMRFANRKLSMMLQIRSNDCYLGQPYNIAEYAILLHMIAQVVNMIPNELIINIGDAHLYTNSFDAAKSLLNRESFPLPKIKLNPDIKNIYDFRYEDIEILDYQSHKNIKVDVAI